MRVSCIVGLPALFSTAFAAGAEDVGADNFTFLPLLKGVPDSREKRRNRAMNKKSGLMVLRLSSLIVPGLLWVGFGVELLEEVPG